MIIRGLVIILIAMLGALCFAGLFPVNSATTQTFAAGAVWMAAIWFTARVGRR
jgi:hypothetical protein